jgi:hypothetical protein
MATLSFDFNALKIITCCELTVCKNTFLPLWKLGGGFKPAAVTTTYVDNIGKSRSCYCSRVPADQLDRHPEAQVIINFYNGIKVLLLQYNLAGVTFRSI